MDDTTEQTGSPYPGLRAFERDETHIFFGREETVSDMVDRMAGHRFLAVTGYSGSGKSSLVKVGLLDALDRGMLIEAGSGWAIAEFTPGGEPFARMTAALINAVGRQFSDAELGLIEAQLTRGPKGLLDWLDDIDFPAETNLLLVVDQFEEIFRYHKGRTGDEINAFVQLLLASAQQRDRPIYIILTMRSDFLGDCARFTGLAEQINDGQFLTPRLTRKQCRDAIESPAGVFGGKVEPALVTRMLNDMAGNPDQLPLMQHVLMLLWDRAVARTKGGQPLLALADYDSLGGIGYTDWQSSDEGTGTKKVAGGEGKSGKGALSDHADHVLHDLKPDQRVLAERLFRALTESRGGGDRAVRRPIRLDQAAAITEASTAALLPVIEAFKAPGRHFIVTKPPRPLTGDTIIDISHESLIRQWGQLRQWAQIEQQSAETYRHIERSAKQWKKGMGNLLSKFDLAVAQRWRKEEAPNKAWAQRYGDAFDLSMSFVGKSNRTRIRKKLVRATLGVSVPLALIVATAALMAIATTGVPYMNPANEWSNFEAEPQRTLRSDVGTNTPNAVPGGRVIGTAELERAMQRGQLNGSSFVLVDTWETNDYKSYIPGSVHLDYAGQYGEGHFNDAIQAKLKVKLHELTGGNLDMPLVVFCVGTRCWTSYNASLRAINLGYKQVYWYRGGISSWNEAHRSIELDFDVLNFQTSESVKIATHMGETVKQKLWPTESYAYDSGGTYLKKQRFDFAIDNFSASIKRQYKVAESHIGRAQAYDGKHEYEAAIADYSKALELDPKNPRAWALRGFAKKNFGLTEDGLEDIRKAAALDAKYAAEIDSYLVTVHNRLGNEHFNKGNYGQAIESYKEASKLSPKDAILVKNLANAHYRRGDFGSAVQDYGRAIELTPKDVTLFAARGDAYRDQGNFASAIADYDSAIGLNTKSAVYVEKRGYARFYSGDSVSAVADFARAGQLDGDNSVYRVIFRYLARARAAAGGTAVIELTSDGKRLLDAGTLKSDAWAIEIFSLLSGKSSPEAILKAASNADEKCEAHFYAGQWHLLRDDKAAARTMLSVSSKTCQKSYFEYLASLADLKRLGPEN